MMDEHVKTGDAIAAIPPIAVSASHLVGLTLGEAVQAATLVYTCLLITFFVWDKIIRPHTRWRKK